jgi:transposase-like protein
VGAKVVVLRTASPSIKAEFAAWHFSADRRGSQREWAREHGVHPTTLSIWKREGWYAAIAAEWGRNQDAHFAEVVDALYVRAVDPHDPQDVRAARLLAELLGKFPKTRADDPRDLFGWLKAIGEAERAGTITDGT